MKEHDREIYTSLDVRSPNSITAHVGLICARLNVVIIIMYKIFMSTTQIF
jgi:hypothetical protein